MMLELKYFDAPGRAEPIRIMLHAAGVDFTDNRSCGTNWPAFKLTTPLGSVPVLNVDGTDFCQSVALQRYAAKLAGFYPTDELKALIVDEVTDSINECTSKAPQGGTAEEKKANREAYQKDVMTKYFGLVESRIQQFGGATNTVCGVVSGADVLLMVVVKGIQSGQWDHIDTEFFKAYPGITACVEQTGNHEKVKAYYDSLEQKKAD